MTFKLVRASFRVNLAQFTQIRSAVSEILLHTQTKRPKTDGAKNRTFRSSLRAVKMMEMRKKDIDARGT